MNFNQHKTETQDSELDEGPAQRELFIRIALIFAVAGLGYITRTAYLRYMGEELTLDLIYGYLFVKHQAISMPIIVVAMVGALLADHIRAKRNQAPPLRLFWKVIAVFSIVFAGYISIHGI